MRARSTRILVVAIAMAPVPVLGQSEETSRGRWSVHAILEEPAPRTSSIEGRVTDRITGQVLPNAQVYLQGISIGALADSTGWFSLLNVPLGIHVLRVDRVGYSSRSMELVLGSGQEAVGHFELDEFVWVDGGMWVGPRAPPRPDPPKPLCDPGLGRGIRLVVRDLATGRAPTAAVQIDVVGEMSGAQVHAVSHYEGAPVLRTDVGVSTEGEYSVRVTAPGYIAWSEEEVRVDATACRSPMSRPLHVWLVRASPRGVRESAPDASPTRSSDPK